MKNLLKLEELAQFIPCLAALILTGADWWWYMLLFIGPDIGMLGYLVNTKIGGFTYNMLHHKAVAMVIFWLSVELGYIGDDGDPKVHLELAYTSLVLYGHASMDRIFGYGLKFGDNFHHTHLGWIGKGVASDE